MALFQSEQTHKRWAIKCFPLELKDKLKARCKKEKREMVSIARFLVRSYVDETAEMYKSKEYKETARYEYADMKMWNMSSFPIKLHADFKACCISRGDTITEALTHQVKEYVDGL